MKYPRTPGYRPTGDENKHNAWYVKTTVEGASRGKLKGKTVVLKDNIMLAGVPMMNGAATLEGYVPDIDATVVTRILDAGGTIVGKAHCENFCLSGGSHTNATGPVHNPHKMGYSAGGSSSGSAVLVALGEVDMALGGDQGGSIRMPASFCGIYGMKPTHGLVPYTGIMPIEIYVDHTGPMTANGRRQRAAARGAGRPRRLRPAADQRQDASLHQGAAGRHQGHEDRPGDGGLCARPMPRPTSTPRCKAAAKKFEGWAPRWARSRSPCTWSAAALWMPIGTEGLTQTMMWGDGYGVSRPDLYVTSLMDFHRNWRNRANEMSETTKLFTMLGTYIRRYYGSRYYGKAMNQTRLLTAAYDAALARLRPADDADDADQGDRAAAAPTRRASSMSSAR